MFGAKYCRVPQTNICLPGRTLPLLFLPSCCLIFGPWLLYASQQKCTHSSWLLWQSPYPGQCLEPLLTSPHAFPLSLSFIFLLQLLCEDEIHSHRSKTTLFLLSTNALLCQLAIPAFYRKYYVNCVIDPLSVIIKYDCSRYSKDTFRIKLSFFHILVFVLLPQCITRHLLATSLVGHRWSLTSFLTLF